MNMDIRMKTHININMYIHKYAFICVYIQPETRDPKHRRGYGDGWGGWPSRAGRSRGRASSPRCCSSSRSSSSMTLGQKSETSPPPTPPRFLSRSVSLPRSPPRFLSLTHSLPLSLSLSLAKSWMDGGTCVSRKALIKRL